MHDSDKKDNFKKSTKSASFRLIMALIVKEVFRYNGRNPYQIICKSDNLEISEYVSENIWCNPETIIKERNITSFPVYLDPENPKKYYLSTEEIDKYIQLK